VRRRRGGGRAGVAAAAAAAARGRSGSSSSTSSTVLPTYPNTDSGRTTRRPGESIGTSTMECCWWRGRSLSSASHPIKMHTLQSGCEAPLIHHWVGRGDGGEREGGPIRRPDDGGGGPRSLPTRRAGRGGAGRFGRPADGGGPRSLPTRQAGRGGAGRSAGQTAAAAALSLFRPAHSPWSRSARPCRRRGRAPWPPCWSRRTTPRPALSWRSTSGCRRSRAARATPSSARPTRTGAGLPCCPCRGPNS